jgi:predicted membrane chloride channel (bestrophin family)
VLEKENLIPYKLKDRIFKYMKDMHESIENLHAIHTHRTPISLMAYCEVFIYIFPLIYAPTIIYNLGIQGADWVAYFIVLLTQFILISLYNIQNQLEYPFDNIGMDDINLDNFKIER